MPCMYRLGFPTMAPMTKSRLLASTTVRSLLLLLLLLLLLRGQTTIQHYRRCLRVCLLKLEAGRG